MRKYLKIVTMCKEDIMQYMMIMVRDGNTKWEVWKTFPIYQEGNSYTVPVLLIEQLRVLRRSGYRFVTDQDDVRDLTEEIN